MQQSTSDVVADQRVEQCVQLVDVMGSDARVVNAARVSLGKWVEEKAPLNTKDGNLIQYLADHGHDSPFFHPQICFRIQMPLFVAREWFRHTVGLTRNEVSRRYVDGAVVCALPVQIRKRHPTAKQGSSEQTVDNEPFCRDLMKSTMSFCVASYRQLLAQGVAPELARMVLPQSMMTEFIETGSLAAYARLCRLRLSVDAQSEIRVYAQQIHTVLLARFPIAWAALSKNKI